MTWTAPAVDRPEPEYVAGERTTLDQFLDYHRATLLWKCSGLTTEQLKTRAVSPSVMSLLGIVRHMVEVERGWFGSVVGGQQLPYEYCTDDLNADFDDLDSADAQADLTTYQREVERSREVASSHDLDEIIPSRREGRPPRSVRWIYVHMIEEYARHNGHADLLREAIDGTTGE
jgi:uncharacterized damage-inducible protein DinB